MARKKKVEEIKSLLNIKSKLCTNMELSDRFISDVLRITGLEVDHEGYIVDSEEDIYEPEYILIKGKVLRYTNQGIRHNKDLVFDPYNNPMIMEELFKQYLQTCHPEVVSTHVNAFKPGVIPKTDTFGYIVILYGNGASIRTAPHFKDSTKYLDAFMRLESMTDNLILDTLKPYDEYERELFKNE